MKEPQAFDGTRHDPQPRVNRESSRISVEVPVHPELGRHLELRAHDPRQAGPGPEPGVDTRRKEAVEGGDGGVLGIDVPQRVDA